MHQGHQVKVKVTGAKGHRSVTKCTHLRVIHLRLKENLVLATCLAVCATFCMKTCYKVQQLLHIRNVPNITRDQCFSSVNPDKATVNFGQKIFGNAAREKHDLWIIADRACCSCCRGDDIIHQFIELIAKVTGANVTNGVLIELPARAKNC